MTRRGLVIASHWLLFLLLLAMIKGGTSALWLRWTFVGIGAVWVAQAAIFGILARPGPKLQGPLRAAFPALHWGLYALVALSVALNAGALMGLVTLDAAWVSLLVLLAAGTFHAIFHLWRHTALNDGALRKITPKALHKIL